MKKLLLFIILIYSTLVFSQENWGYLPVEITDNFHGAICPIDENVVHVVSDYGVFYKTDDGGETWSQFDSGVNEIFLDLDFDGTQNGYAVGAEGKILKTDNAGQTWAELSSGTAEALVAIAVNAENSIWAVGNNGIILHSTNGGNSWTSNTALTSENLNDIMFKDENIGYIAGDNGVLFYTENDGIDWTQLTVPTTDDLSSISINTSETNLLAGVSGGVFDEYSYQADVFYKSSDNITWEQGVMGDILLGAANMFFTNENIGYAISSGTCLCNECYLKINKTVDGGANWQESFYDESNAENCIANDGYMDIEFASETVGYALVGRNILKTPYQSAGISDFNKTNSFTIYPNPTENGNFNLKFDISELQGISIEIVDIHGRKLFVQTDLQLNNNISLPNLSEGIYFVKLIKNGKIIVIEKLLKQ